MSQEKTTLLEFPCSFDIKIMGVNHQDLVAEIIAIVAAQSTSFNPDSDINTKLSTKGNYLSVTVSLNAESQQQLDNIYLLLNKHELVKITL